MAKLLAFAATSLLLVTSVLAQNSAVSCETLDDGIEKIKCTFVTQRKNIQREVTFQWHSESHPQDDRERSIALPANHGSVYDYRYLRGRAPGIWNVSVTLTDADGNEETVSHHFLLEDNKIINEAKK